MKRRFALFAATACGLCFSAVAPTAHARSYAVTLERCGVVALTPQPSDDPHVKIYSFEETGTTTTHGIGPVNPNPMIAALSDMKYRCTGAFVTAAYPVAAGPGPAWKWSAASCTFSDGTPDTIHAQATSMGAGTTSAPPAPPVDLRLLHGTGKFSGIQGKARGPGPMPISETSISTPKCTSERWRFTLPDRPVRPVRP